MQWNVLAFQLDVFFSEFAMELPCRSLLYLFENFSSNKDNGTLLITLAYIGLIIPVLTHPVYPNKRNYEIKIKNYCKRGKKFAKKNKAKLLLHRIRD